MDLEWTLYSLKDASSTDPLLKTSGQVFIEERRTSSRATIEWTSVSIKEYVLRATRMLGENQNAIREIGQS
jgi:hypothetical protein